MGFGLAAAFGPKRLNAIPDNSSAIKKVSRPCTDMAKPAWMTHFRHGVFFFIVTPGQLNR